ncbi:hypothetical protein DAPPUDRAFT_260138 [Daphnia pulex]|uniref:Calx-beta domain-containing protein n=1 Tax=Daphnia pulex TaxID=6669 RepID=E9HIK8_DAPPU|nr:hypothetical protein DAPPUDRAFT_260138 [Daphnia pulex]|eukprot:EFX68424.1 hypothetical protein DAPPUDRAFT_260138 [Daphnia pulex]
MSCHPAAIDENGANGLAPLPRVPLRPGALMIAIEPRDNQPPEVVVHGEVTVDEGATEILSPAVLSVNDSDTLVVVIVDGLKHGNLEVRDRSDHKGSEPRQDSFRFYVRDTSDNRSPPSQLDIVIEDKDSEPSDLQITLVAQPTNGRLQRFDPLTNSDRMLQNGETSDYQELLDGNIALISSAEETQIVFRVTDGNSSAGQEVTLRYVNKQQDEELFGRSGGTTPCLMEFNTTEWKSGENSGVAAVTVVRTGDFSITCSVICFTEAQSADDSKDFYSRPVAESSRVFFLRGVTVIYCPVQIKDDSFYEGDETFLARLSHPQVEQLETGGGQQTADQPKVAPGSSSSAVIGSLSTFAVRIHYPGPVQSVRLPLDGSDKEGKGYVLKGRQSLQFGLGEKWTSFSVAFLNANHKNTWTKSFQIALSPEDSINAKLGADRLGADLDKRPTSVPAGYPVVCVTPCDPKYPLYNISTQRLCRNMAIDVSKIRFSWDISLSSRGSSSRSSSQEPLSQIRSIFSQTSDSTAGPFYRLSEPTAFSGIEDRVLDAVFFGRDFKIRCVAQPVRLDSAMMVGPASKSRPVMVSGQSGLCPPFAPNSLASDDPSDDQAMVAAQQPSRHPCSTSTQAIRSIRTRCASKSSCPTRTD